MNHIPKLSVLITSFNDGKYISKCLDSILHQTFQDFEIIIVDDASKDNTVEIIKSYMKKDFRIKLIINRENLGLARSLNRGMQYCSADLIARQDADDYSVLSRFEEQINYLNKFPNIVLLGTQEIRVDESGCEMEPQWYPIEYQNILKTLKEQNCFNHSSVIFRKSIILSVGMYRPFPGCQDYDLWVRLVQHNKAENMEKQLIYRRLRNNSISFKHIQLQTASYSVIHKLAKQRFDSGYDELDNLTEKILEDKIWYLVNKEIKLNRKLCGSKNVHLFGHMLKTSGKKGAFIYILRALRLDPFNPYIVRLFLDTYVSKKIWYYLSGFKKRIFNRNNKISEN